MGLTFACGSVVPESGTTCALARPEYCACHAAKAPTAAITRVRMPAENSGAKGGVFRPVKQSMYAFHKAPSCRGQGGLLSGSAGFS
jgi:hypothetical protein